MSTVLGVVDGGAATRPVADVAAALARIVGIEVDVLHVRPATARPGATPLPARIEQGEPDDVVLEAIRDDDVVMVVIGARAAPGGPRPVGHLTGAVVTGTTKPIVVVPPDLAPDRRSLRRVVVPVEGGGEPSHDLRAAVSAFELAGSAVVAVHIFDRAAVPAFWEGWQDTELWADEFGRRFAPGTPDVPLELCTGDIATAVLEMCDRHEADLVALEWRQTFDGGRGAVVRDVLSRTTIPVLLASTTEDAHDDVVH
ncbi:MAG: universal stress protein [Actinomycetota bacterium]